MNLKDFTTEKPLSFEAEFPEEGSGFWVVMRYLPAEELRRVQNEAANKSLVIKGNTVRSKNEDGQAVINTGLARLILGWRGLTPKLAATLVPGFQVADCERALEQAGLTDIPCEHDNKLFLIKQAHGFAQFVQNSAAEAANFQARELAEEIKN